MSHSKPHQPGFPLRGEHVTRAQPQPAYSARSHTGKVQRLKAASIREIQAALNRWQRTAVDSHA